MIKIKRTEKSGERKEEFWFEKKVNPQVYLVLVIGYIKILYNVFLKKWSYFNIKLLYLL